MTTKLSEMMAEFSEEDRKDIDKRVKAHLKAMQTAARLDELRRAVNKTQGDIALAMGIGQNAVSQLEKRGDMQLSTLHRYVESVGFALQLTVVAPNGERVTLEKFKPWEAREAAEAPSRKRRAVSADELVGKTVGTKRTRAAAKGARAGTK